MRILHLSAVKNRGGGENHIENLCFELEKHYPEVSNMILCRKNSLFEKSLRNKAIKYFTSPIVSNFDPRYISKIISVSKKEKIDLIHIHDPSALGLAVIADKFYSLPPFIFSKKISFPVRQKKLTLYKYNYPKIRKYLCVSEQTRQIMAQAIEDKEKLVTIYHGTRLDTKSAATPFLLRDKLSIPSTSIMVGNVANHHFSKDLDTLIDVADHLINRLKIKNIHFVQIGLFTKLSEPWLERVKQLNLQKHFNFLGYQKNASNFIPQFDIFLLTSTNEGLPQVIYEAFYHNVPVVSTRVAGVPEVIENGENRLQAEKRDFKRLGEHVLTLSKDHDLRAKITATNKKLVTEKFSTTKMAEKTLKEYKKAIDGRLH